MVDTLLELLRRPGETATAWLQEHLPALTGFLGIDEGTGRSTAVVTLAVLTWLAALLLLGLVVEKIRDVDRKLTSYVSGRHAEARRQFRILLRRIASAIGLLRRRREAAAGITVATVELPQLHSRILRCLGGAGEGHGMAAVAVAERLKLSSHQVEGVIRRLMEDHLVERSFGTDEGLEAHRITQAGQIYLLEH